MRIPFVDYVVTSYNFDGIVGYENYNYSIKKNEDCIEIVFKNSIPCPLYYYVDGHGCHYYALKEEVLYNHLCNIKIFPNKYEGTFCLSNNNPSDNCIQSHTHLNLFCVKNYHNMKVYKDCVTFDYINDYYTVPIQEGGEIIKAWIDRYKNVMSLIPCEKLVIDMSAGLDTRSLTYFWKDNTHFSHVTIYSKLSGDGTTVEIPIVRQIIKYLEEKHNIDINLVHTKDKKNSITIGGKGADVWAVPSRFRNRCFLDGYVSVKTGTYYLDSILPYLDRDLLRIRADYPTQMKTIMQYLLAEEFIGKIPYYSFARKEYIFTKEMEKEAKEMIRRWGL